MVKDEILNVLEDLLNYDDIYGCMLIEKGMAGITPPVEKFKGNIMEIWDILQKTIDDVFSIIQQYMDYNLGEISLRLMDYEVMFFVLPQSDTALVVMVPNSANKGIIEIAVESARNRIIKILE